MSCNGCRVLRKGCSETCILRPCLQWIENSEAQGYATVFVAKFFGRAGLMGFISAVPEHQRPELFQSLLFEACGRTVNPVLGTVGLLWSGNWQICQAAVKTVLKGGSLSPLSPPIGLPENLSLSAPYSPDFAKNGVYPFPSAGGVNGPNQMIFPFSSNASLDNPAERHTVSLGIGFSEAGGDECKERIRVSHNISNENRLWDGASVRNVEPCSLWQRDGRCHNSNQTYVNAEFRAGNLGQEFYDSKLKSGRSQGMRLAPRRVRTRVQASSVAPSAFGEEPHDEFRVSDHGAEQLELDLTLKVKGGRGDKMVGIKRLSSPCDSLNSEGSVISLDSIHRESHKSSSSWVLEMNPLQPHIRTLLPLLQ